MDPIFSYAAGILRGPQEALPSGDTIPGTFTEILGIFTEFIWIPSLFMQQV